MIAGLVPHAGGQALARHLARKDQNETIRVSTCGLASSNIEDCVAELELLASGCRGRKPLLHVWVSPSKRYSDQQWEEYWESFEEEFGLKFQPYVEVAHLKLGEGGRTAVHKHRVYLLVRPDRTTIGLSHSWRRIEKLSRLSELRTGEALVKGAHNKAVVNALRSEGREWEASVIEAAGLTKGMRSVAPSPVERQMASRMQDISTDELWRRAFAAWQRSDNGPSFLAAAAAEGLTVALGEKEPVLVGPNGSTLGLRRAVASGARREGVRPVRKAELLKKIGNLKLPPLSEVLRNLKSQRADPLQSIVGLERSVPRPDENHAAASDEAGIAELSCEPAAENSNEFVPVTHSDLTVAQQRAVINFENALEGRSALFSRRLRRRVEAKVARKRAQRVELWVRAGALGGNPKVPAIGIPGWRDAFKAKLAGVPPELGSLLHFVAREEGSCKKIILKSGTIINATNDRATASAATGDTVPVLVGHAIASGWQEIIVTGGTPQWRQAVMRAAIEAGIQVVNSEVTPVEPNEHQKRQAMR